jgi:hypothetical protein
MIADFIGGPWHLQTKPIRTNPLINSAGDQMVLVEKFIAVPIKPPPLSLPLCDKVTKIKFEVCHYRLVIQTPTYCVYVDTSQPLARTDSRYDISDPVRYFFAREHRFQEEMHGWTHHNVDFGLASAEGILGMMRFRKRKT